MYINLATGNSNAHWKNWTSPEYGRFISRIFSKYFWNISIPRQHFYTMELDKTVEIDFL